MIQADCMALSPFVTESLLLQRFPLALSLSISCHRSIVWSPIYPNLPICAWSNSKLKHPFLRFIYSNCLDGGYVRITIAIIRNRLLFIAKICCSTSMLQIKSRKWYYHSANDKTYLAKEWNQQLQSLRIERMKERDHCQWLHSHLLSRYCVSFWFDLGV